MDGMDSLALALTAAAAIWKWAPTTAQSKSVCNERHHQLTGTLARIEAKLDRHLELHGGPR